MNVVQIPISENSSIKLAHRVATVNIVQMPISDNGSIKLAHRQLDDVYTESTKAAWSKSI